MKQVEVNLAVSQKELVFLQSLIESERFNLSGVVRIVKKPEFSQELEVAEGLEQKISKLTPQRA